MPVATARSQIILLATLSGFGAWFLAGTLPYLGNYPTLDWPQMGIAAPAHKLATEGVYGNDLFTGFYRTERRNYEYMPAYPLLVAVSFKLFGTGVVQARLVSVLCGLLTLGLVFQLTRMLFDRWIGVVAVGLLAIARFNPRAAGSGIPLVDLSRIIRYDNLVPVFVLVACITFVYGLRLQNGWKQNLTVLAAGMAAGLATLSHLYGAFVLTVLIVCLLWCSGSSAFRRFPLYGLVLGWFVSVLPWIIYVLQDVPAYVGQMTRHEGRFDVLSPAFYLSNMLREPRRYSAWLGGFPEGLWQVRIGLWVVGIAALGGWFLTVRRLLQRRSHDVAPLLASLALPLLALQLGLLVSLKRAEYTILVLPFVAMLAALGLVRLWRVATERNAPMIRLGLMLIACLIAVESAVGVRGSLRAAEETSDYEVLTTRLANAIPPGNKVLLSQPYWMGLAHFETRSINLPFVKAEEVPMEATLREINADYVVVERSSIDPSIPDPRRSPIARWIRLWEQFANFVAQECPRRVLAIDDPSYGLVDVYACDGDSG